MLRQGIVHALPHFTPLSFARWKPSVKHQLALLYRKGGGAAALWLGEGFGTCHEFGEKMPVFSWTAAIFFGAKP